VKRLIHSNDRYVMAIRTKSAARQADPEG
jgi:hypothetical protein